MTLIVKGRITKGGGHYRIRFKNPRVIAELLERTGITFVCGTLNLDIGFTLAIKPTISFNGEIVGEGSGVEYVMEPCTVDGHPGYRFRGGYDGTGKIEVACGVKLEKTLGDCVTVAFPGREE